MKTEIKNVTPELAKLFLQQNSGNRKINKSQLDMLKRSIENNEWMVTHQGIAFYDDGMLADGQHRLMAIAETGISCKMMITYGIKKDTDTVMALDCGRGRTVVESSQMTDVKVTVRDSTLAKGFEFGYNYDQKKLTHKEVYLLCEKHKEKLATSSRVCRTNNKGVSVAPIKVAIVNSIDHNFTEAVATEFYLTLINGIYNREIMQNAVVLRNKLLARNYGGSGGRKLVHELTLIAIDAIKNNKVLRRIRG